jgi:uncharacterized ParB-like nuclease family protein
MDARARAQRRDREDRPRRPPRRRPRNESQRTGDARGRPGSVLGVRYSAVGPTPMYTCGGCVCLRAVSRSGRPSRLAARKSKSRCVV